MTVLELIQRSTEFLARKGVDSPRLQAELLLAHVLRMPRLKLYLDFERQLSEPDLERLRELVKRRAAREPLQHILGSTSFCGLEVKVTPDVLIPRPETEMLAERAWQSLQARVATGQTEVSALDFGTGSGCIAITLARHVPQASLWALDRSAAALAVARENAAAHQVADRIQFLDSDGFTGLPKDRRFDLIATNPPYIPSAQIGQLAPEVRDHDPRLALDGGEDGLDFYRLLAREAAAYLAPGGDLIAEFGDGQSEALRHLFGAAGWEVRAVVPDLSGRARIFIASPSQS